MTPSILIKGVSSFVNNSYAESLTYNWVSIEQIIDHIWELDFVKKIPQKSITGRKDFLTDSRSWTSSTRIEMFYQREIINEDLYNQLSKVRKARNKFVHTGETPDKEASTIAYNTLFEMISLVNSNYQSTTDFDSLRKKFIELDPIKRTFYDERPKEIKDVQYWLDSPIPEIPGDEKWNENDYEYEIGFEHENKPVPNKK